jgi:mannosyl-glycoprotein endo-beta-N-acetylglucosaminidase
LQQAWHKIDTFVYFSHNLVTVPPTSWTNAAHRNGTKCLGTLITEHAEGEANCASILESVATAEAFADRLVQIAAHYRFDGWLVNIENPLTVDQVRRLGKFLSYLTEQMHAAVPESEVIWYDAVTVSGALAWQNMLNTQNAPFFDVCDGIFLNYHWQPNMLERSKVNARRGRKRNFDVYAGIDVFGRGTFGGGGMKSKAACTEIVAAAVSGAVFAPGWVFEEEQFDVTEFDKSNALFWAQFDAFYSKRIVGV